MPVPKFRTSRSKRNQRRSHHGISRPNVSICQNCQSVKSSHSVCESCGHYRGEQVMMPRNFQVNQESFETEG